MKKKTKRIIYWVVTIIFVLANFLSGVAGFFPNEEGKAVMAALGYPVYFGLMLSVAKILGSIAIIQTKFKTVKEWAYAGFTFDYIAAFVSFAATTRDPLGFVMPVIFLAVLIVSYASWKQVDHN